MVVLFIAPLFPRSRYISTSVLEKPISNKLSLIVSFNQIHRITVGAYRYNQPIFIYYFLLLLFSLIEYEFLINPSGGGEKMNKRILGLFACLVVSTMLTIPMVVSAKPVVKSVTFEIESWPAGPTGDWSKYTEFFAGESGNLKLLRLPLEGQPPLLDVVPDPAAFTADPFSYLGRGGVRLIIDGTDILGEGRVEKMLIQTSLFADWSSLATEKWTFMFDDSEQSTLELSIVTNNGEGKCVGTRGTGYFEGAQFKGTFTEVLYWYVTPEWLGGWNAAFSVIDGTGELMLK
jgi:hypothetical protein